jgi:hypothetical protein
MREKPRPEMDTVMDEWQDTSLFLDATKTSCSHAMALNVQPGYSMHHAYMDQQQGTALLPLETVWEQYFGWQKHELESTPETVGYGMGFCLRHVLLSDDLVTNAKVSKALWSILPYLSQHSVHSINFIFIEHLPLLSPLILRYQCKTHGLYFQLRALMELN